jgi:hypothetical protein
VNALVPQQFLVNLEPYDGDGYSLQGDMMHAGLHPERHGRLSPRTPEGWRSKIHPRTIPLAREIASVPLCHLTDISDPFVSLFASCS